MGFYCHGCKSLFHENQQLEKDNELLLAIKDAAKEFHRIWKDGSFTEMWMSAMGVLKIALDDWNNRKKVKDENSK
ncbi:MAG: hypothetical protein KAS32_19375 [Candidatus Peribacteraceae bacterium]|nr:hypothetical protein [Candidatus Peribacteraceae bacterium]